MTKRMVAFKKMMLLLGMGGAAFTFGIFGGGDVGCVRNSDLVTFYQGAGDASIAAFADSTANIIGSDFDNIVIAPTAGFFTAMWDNWVAQQFPLDLDPANIILQ
ncbi:MAG: hypothetical protein ACE5I3_02600 [Phycisphaerae bacterium]